MVHTLSPQTNCASRRPRPRRGRRSGFTVLELTVALSILAIAIGGLVAASASSYHLSRSNQARSIAHEAVRQKIAEIRSVAPELVYAMYNDDPADDPAGFAPGSGFAVDDLRPRANDPDGFVGRVFFPGDGTGELREDLVMKSLDMPRDLNLDGVIDADDHAGDYVLLPVGVELDWRGARSNAHHQVHFLLMAIR